MGTSEKIAATAGTASGAASILGSWQVCHAVCLGLIALLGVMGITVVGMPLAFFTRIAIPLWSVAVALLLVTFIMYRKLHCISRNLLVMNLGLIIAGTPFPAVQAFAPGFWLIGGMVALRGLIDVIDEKRSKRTCHEH